MEVIIMSFSLDLLQKIPFAYSYPYVHKIAAFCISADHSKFAAIVKLAKKSFFSQSEWSIKIWDANRIDEIATIPLPYSSKEKAFFFSGRIEKLALSSDGKYLATCDSNGVTRIWDVMNRKSLFTCEDVFQKNCLHLMFSETNDCFYRNNKTWNFESSKPIKTLGCSEYASYSTDGKFLVNFNVKKIDVSVLIPSVSYRESLFSILDYQTGLNVGSLDIDENQIPIYSPNFFPEEIIVSPNKELIAFDWGGENENAILIYDLNTGEQKLCIHNKSKAPLFSSIPPSYQSAFACAKSIFATAHREQNKTILEVYNISDFQVINSTALDEKKYGKKDVYTLCFSLRNKFLAASLGRFDGKYGQVILFDTSKDLVEITAIETPKYVRDRIDFLAFSEDDSILIGRGYENIYLWKLSSR